MPRLFAAGATRLAAGAALALAAATAQAATIGFTGSFEKDDDVALFEFSVGPGGLAVEIRTFGYGGGTFADGRVIASGGFDPSLWLFDGAGNYTGFYDEDWDNSGSLATPDPISGARYDARILAYLTEGDYILAMTQVDNMPLAAGTPGLTLSDGFQRDGQPNYTVDTQSPWCEAGSTFCDYWVEDGHSLTRTGDWAIQFSSITRASGPGGGPETGSQVPLPAALPLLASGLFGLAALGRRSRRA